MGTRAGPSDRSRGRNSNPRPGHPAQSSGPQPRGAPKACLARLRSAYCARMQRRDAPRNHARSSPRAPRIAPGCFPSPGRPRRPCSRWSREFSPRSKASFAHRELTTRCFAPPSVARACTRRSAETCARGARAALAPSVFFEASCPTDRNWSAATPRQNPKLSKAEPRLRRRPLTKTQAKVASGW